MISPLFDGNVLFQAWKFLLNLICRGLFVGFFFDKREDQGRLKEKNAPKFCILAMLHPLLVQPSCRFYNTCDDNYFISISKLYSHVFFPVMDLIDLQRTRGDPTLELSMTNNNILLHQNLTFEFAHEIILTCYFEPNPGTTIWLQWQRQ
jgi:hypothetical protein